MPRFVLEIGTEEIPPRFFPPALAQLRRDGRQMLERARLGFEDVKVYGTPRRLALIVEAIADRQAPETREERGPAAKVAFDADGNPTKAAQGFARRCGLAPEQLVKKETDQGEYVFAVVRAPELPAGEALAGLLPDLIAGLSFPKTMRWGTGKLRFGRPIRWLLALVGEDVVSFELEGLRSGRETRGHPVLADGMKPVESAAAYEGALRERFVLVDPDERVELIYRQIQGIATTHEASAHRAVRDEETIEQLMEKPEEFAQVVAWNLAIETAFLVEFPTAACGSFSEEFLELPEEVLIEEMIHVQSYFPLKDSGGRLLPRFIAIRDGGEEHLGTVVRGWESVLRAKLIDASYFYSEDRKRRLDDYVSDLEGMVFHEKLGTVHDKMQRLSTIAAVAGQQLRLSPRQKSDLVRAAVLCKADLATQMVAELSGLQGTMGSIYARKDREHTAVWEAIGQHYRPRSADDDILDRIPDETEGEIPDAGIGSVLAVADRVDTLAAFHALGVVPTGSADPFGLRREAYGIIRILAPAEDEGVGPLRLTSLSQLVETAAAQLHSQFSIDKPATEIVSGVMGFLRDRLAVYLREKGIRYDLVDAALASGIDDILAAAERARTLNELKDSPDFLPTVIACTRPMNISKDFEGGDVDPKLFQDPSENALWEAYQKVASQADDVPLSKLFELIATELRAPIDTYFDDVLVMAEDEKLRRNRLAVCWQISQLFRRIADFSLIVQA